MGRPGKYLFKHQNSANWHLRLTYPPGYFDPNNPSKTKAIRRVKEQSLCTPNYREAEAIAAPLIAEHKKNLWAHQNEKAKRYVYEYAPSLYPPGKTYELEPGEEWDLPEGGSVD